MKRELIEKKSVLQKLDGFSDKEHGNEHFLYGIETAKEIIQNEPCIVDLQAVLDALSQALKEAEEEHDINAWQAYAYAISLLTEDEED